MENPYLQVISRRSRNLKKKLNKVDEAEQKMKSGKTLNDEQLSLVASKGLVERMLSELDAIRASLEEVEAEELGKKVEKVTISVPASANTGLSASAANLERLLKFFQVFLNPSYFKGAFSCQLSNKLAAFLFF